MAKRNMEYKIIQKVERDITVESPEPITERTAKNRGLARFRSELNMLGILVVKQVDVIFARRPEKLDEDGRLWKISCTLNKMGWVPRQDSIEDNQ